MFGVESARIQSDASTIEVDMSFRSSRGVGAVDARGATQIEDGSSESPQPFIFRILSLAVQSLKNAHVFSSRLGINASAARSVAEQDCSIIPSNSGTVLTFSRSTPIAATYPTATINESPELLVLKESSGAPTKLGLPNGEYSNSRDVAEDNLYFARIRRSAMRLSTNRRNGSSRAKDFARSFSLPERSSCQWGHSATGRFIHHTSTDVRRASASVEGGVAKNILTILN